MRWETFTFSKTEIRDQNLRKEEKKNKNNENEQILNEEKLVQHLTKYLRQIWQVIKTLIDCYVIRNSNIQLPQPAAPKCIKEN